MIISTNIRTAKKEHRCDFCNQPILPGEKYEDQYNKYDGEAYHWKSHLSCKQLTSELNMYDDCWCDAGLTAEEFRENVEQYLYDMGVQFVWSWKERIVKAKEMLCKQAEGV